MGLSTPRVQIGTLYFVALLREELGRRIATARHDAGLSQQDLAERIGLKHAQDVSRYERGKVEVPSFRIDRIAEATGRPRSYFVRDPLEPELPTGESASLDALLEGQETILELLRENAARLARIEQAVSGSAPD